LCGKPEQISDDPRRADPGAITLSRKHPATPTTMAGFGETEAAAWRMLSATWRGLLDSALVQPGACGDEWSVKDVWNHLAAWMDATRAALPALLAGQPLPKGEYHIAAFNARHHAAARDRPVVASRRRLNRARRTLLAFVATLPEAAVLDVKARPGRWIKFATYGHYAEHLDALRAFRSGITSG
jgi:hypothetical protein